MYSPRFSYGKFFRRSQRQRISPSPEPQPNRILSIDRPYSSQPRSTIDIKSNQILSTTSIISPSNNITNSNSVSKMTNQQKLHLSDNVNKNIENFLFLKFLLFFFR